MKVEKMAKAKTIKMLLYDGSLDGVTNISDSAWDGGKMYSAPRESINNLVSKADCKKYGVYLLLSDKQVYVGQAVDLERRTKQHLADKDWWNQVVLMTTKDDSFTASDIDYLEASLIDLAINAGTSDSDNKKMGNRQKVDEFRQAELEQYLEEALFLLELIGVRVFKKTKGKTVKTPPQKHLVLDPDLHNEQTNPKKSTENNAKPELPDMDLGPCVFAKTALTNLLATGYQFSDEQMALYGSVEGSKDYTKRNLPLFWVLKEGESRETYDTNIRSRYWSTEFISGSYRFLMFSQWYSENEKSSAHKVDFIRWYNTL